MAKHESNMTADHEEIRRWAEERGGVPATVKGTEASDEAGVLRIDFPGYGEEAKLRHISWDEFFEKFDEAGLCFVYQEKTADGGTSRFGKFVREGGEGGEGPGRSEGGGGGREDVGRGDSGARPGSGRSSSPESGTKGRGGGVGRKRGRGS